MSESLSPLRRQYLEIKARHPGLILLFQIGDFYEAFDEDAEVLARDLGVTLTRKWFGKDDVHPLAGVPVRALTTHLHRLLQHGHKVAICDQVTLPGKGLVEREVVRVVTPGTVIEPGLLTGRESNYLAALCPGERLFGLAYADITTSEFRATELPPDAARAEIERLRPAELLAPRGLRLRPEDVPGVASITDLPDELPELRGAPPGDGGDDADSVAGRALLEHFGAASLEAYGCSGRPLAARAAGLIVRYLRETQPEALVGLSWLSTYQLDHSLQLDPQAARDLEIFSSGGIGGGIGAGPGPRPDRGGARSLVAAIDLTRTPMGGRLLRAYLRHPLLDLPELRARQDLIEWFVRHDGARERAREALAGVADIERLLGRVRRRLAVPAEVLALRQGLHAALAVRDALRETGAPQALRQPIEDGRALQEVIDLVDRALWPAAAPSAGEGERGFIRPGFSAELDGLRETLHGGRRFLSELEERERQRTGIRSLKVGYNKVFGYYIEVTRPNLRLVPPDYLRKQTLSGAERFFTTALKEHEALIANARESIAELEDALFRALCEEIGRRAEGLLRCARGLARLDVLTALSACAAERGYVRPELHEGEEIRIVAGRHPVLELQIEGFQPNDVVLGGGEGPGQEAPRILLLTAPNMAGKSVYLRQVALICLLGQIGAFVPAQAARLGLVDRIFTRLSLEEGTAAGRSTFFAEMVETARILHQATPRSLVLLDEVGRGTSTADGLAIARAVVEHLHNHPRLRCRTLFATHLHELTACADYLPRVRNIHLLVREEGGQVRYLHRVAPGKAERSFGLHVAQLAGMPRPLLHRAKELLAAGRENDPEARQAAAGEGASAQGPVQAVIEDLLRIDINELSPVEALTRLYELQRAARRAQGG